MTCSRLSFEDMWMIDWDHIDLSEWTGMMAGAGVLPTSADETSITALTCSGQLINSDGRVDTDDRMEDRIQGQELVDQQNQIDETINIFGIDCDIDNPRIQIISAPLMVNIGDG